MSEAVKRGVGHIVDDLAGEQAALQAHEIETIKIAEDRSRAWREIDEKVAKLRAELKAALDLRDFSKSVLDVPPKDLKAFADAVRRTR